MPQSSPVRDGFLDLLQRRIVVAPMAGGPTTTDLVIAATGAGALGFLAAGYKTAEAMTGEITAVRAATDEPFAHWQRASVRWAAGNAYARTICSSRPLHHVSPL